MEYGLDPSFAIYSGGLGILAGDHMKSVGDLHVPVTGIGILWNEGYVRQLISAKGTVKDEYPLTSRDAVRRVDVKLDVTVRGKRVPLRAWKVERFIASDLYLLEPVRPADRWITQRLYGGDDNDRLAQEIKKASTDPKFTAALTPQGMQIIASTPAEMLQAMREDSEKWGRVISDTGTTINQ